MFTETKRFLKNKDLKLIAIIGSVNNFSGPIWNLITPLIIIEKFGLDYKYIGFATLVITLPYTFQYFWGVIIDKVGYKKIVIFSSLFTGILEIGLFFVGNFSELIILLFLRGIAKSFFNISTWTYISEIGEKQNIEGTVAGVYTSIAELLKTISYYLAGTLILFFPIEYMFLIYGILVTFISTVFIKKFLVNKTN